MSCHIAHAPLCMSMLRKSLAVSAYARLHSIALTKCVIHAGDAGRPSSVGGQPEGGA